MKNNEPKILRDCKDTIKKWLFVEDEEALDILLATAVSVKLSGDRVWLFLISPPGGAKSELLRMLSKHSGSYSLDNLTPKTFVSGLRRIKEGKEEVEAKNVDLLPHLRGKVVIFKDLTTLLSKPRYVLDEIFGQLRSIYDGYYEASFGSGMGEEGKKGFSSSFVLMCGVTPAIDRYRKVHQLLGERFLKLRLEVDELEATRKASSNAGREEEMRAELGVAASALLDDVLPKVRWEVTIPPEFEERTVALASLTAALRSNVLRDHMHQVVGYPEVEIGTRLGKQLKTLLVALVCLRGKGEAQEAEYGCLLRVAQDTIPRERQQVLWPILRAEIPVSTPTITREARMPNESVQELLEDLWVLRMLDREEGKPHLWSLTEKARGLVNESRLFERSATSSNSQP